MRYQLQHYRDKLETEKYFNLSLQQWEEASNCRDVQRELSKVIAGTETLKTFLYHIKSQRYINFDKIYEIVKPLDVFSQRKSKLEKLHKKI
jgi:hypothetical protein